MCMHRGSQWRGKKWHTRRAREKRARDKKSPHSFIAERERDKKPRRCDCFSIRRKVFIVLHGENRGAIFMSRALGVNKMNGCALLEAAADSLRRHIVIALCKMSRITMKGAVVATVPAPTTQNCFIREILSHSCVTNERSRKKNTVDGVLHQTIHSERSFGNCSV